MFNLSLFVSWRDIFQNTKGVQSRKFFMRLQRRDIFKVTVSQVWGQDGWILAKFYFWVFLDRDGVKNHENVSKKEARGQYPAILIEHVWS